MKRPVYALFLAASTLSGCATINTGQACQRALTGLTAAREIAEVLVRFGYVAGAAQKAADGIALAEVTASAVCASVP